MNGRMMGYCGIDCRRCPAYVASRQGNARERETLADEWSTEQYPLSTEDIYCEGCKASDDMVMVFCAKCVIRQCAIHRNLANCAQCSEYPCPEISAVFQKSPEARVVLDALYRAR
ncbi:MAG TPA: DUF3795 domain-containing protein [bacterium]|nr:DUF3795 domain-containing protein [bacterium]